MRLFFTPRAESDLDEILSYISELRPGTARKVIQRLRRACELIASQPRIGQRRPDFPGELRSLSVERWVIFYQIHSDDVHIYRVLDGARDIESMFG